MFEASEGAEVRVGEALQISGHTVNDFTEPVDYTVIAEDLTSQIYEVTVEMENLAAVTEAGAGTLNRDGGGSVKTGMAGSHNAAAIFTVLFILLAGGIGYMWCIKGYGKK